LKFYNPTKTIANPHIQIVAPAIGCIYFSNFLTEKKLNPYNDNNTIPSIVTMVKRENTNDTITTPQILDCAAGYISIGINGSHGPNTKIVNSIHGVID